MRQIRTDSVCDNVNIGGDKLRIDISMICGIPSSVSPTSILPHINEISGPIRGSSSPTATIVAINEFTTAERLKPPRSSWRKPHHRRIASCPLQESNHKISTDKKEAIMRRYQLEKDILLIKDLLEEKDQDIRVKRCNQLGTLYYSLGDYKLANDYYNQAANSNCTELSLQAITFQNIGITLWKLGQLERAVTSFRIVLKTRLLQQQREHAEQIKKRPSYDISLEIAQTYQNLGLALLLIQNVDEAMEALETAYGIYTGIRQSQHPTDATSVVIARRLSFMGTAVSHQAKKSSPNEFFLFDIALKYHHTALQMRRDGSNAGHHASSPAIRESLTKIAEIYQNISNFERSLDMYHQVLSLLLQEQLKIDNDSINVERAGTLHRIASVYEKIGDVTNATKYFHDAANALAESRLQCLPF